MIKLKGVGPKMAYLTADHAWKQTFGIGVDVHVHRISNRLGWVDTKNPEKTREVIQHSFKSPLMFTPRRHSKAGFQRTNGLM